MDTDILVTAHWFLGAVDWIDFFACMLCPTQVSGRSCSNGGAMIEYVYAPINAKIPSKKWDWLHVRKRE